MLSGRPSSIKSRRICAALLALLVLVSGCIEAFAKSASDPPLPIIRDAEIEGLLRLYTRPIFRAAGINPKSVRVYLIDDGRINAFVAGGQRIFVNTGLLTQAKSPNVVIGVLAHETGHLAGGHLARMGVELDRASVTAIVGTLLGMAAVVGGVAAGQQQAARAGQGIMIGSQGLAQRNFLTYQRSMEAAADQAALKYLTATKQSAKGMIDLFNTLANQSIATLQNVDPYVLSHPMPFDRIRNLEQAAQKTPYYNAPDDPGLMLRHQLMQAKLTGYQQSASVVFQRYPKSDTSLPARYARAIATFRRGDTQNAIPLFDDLVRELPQNPYFWELKGQALLEGGQAAAAVAPVEKALKLLPNNGLIQILLAQALIGTETKANADRAIKVLKQAQRSEGDVPALYKYLGMAYGLAGDGARAELATAEYAYLQGDKELAVSKAKAAQGLFKKGSPEWTRANDILNFATRD